MKRITEKLKELGIELPEVNPPAANYEPFVQVGCLVFIAGQTCKWNGVLQYAGKVGKDYAIEEAQQAARLCGLNILLHLKNSCRGDLEQVKRCVRLGVFINATEDFSAHAQVANGVSDLMISIFGEHGKHVRTTVGTNSLPSQSAVEVEALFEVTSCEN